MLHLTVFVESANKPVFVNLHWRVIHAAIQPKEKDVEKLGTASDEGKPMESIVEKDTKISMDDPKTIQDEKNVLMEVPTAASEQGLEVVLDVEKEYDLSETMGKAP